MPPKPLEEMLGSFRNLGKCEKCNNDAWAWECIHAEDFIRQVWAEALRYGANKIWDQEWDRIEDHIVEDCHAILLEEAKKALE